VGKVSGVKRIGLNGLRLAIRNPTTIIKERVKNVNSNVIREKLIKITYNRG
jgi:hypothetical protein